MLAPELVKQAIFDAIDAMEIKDLERKKQIVERVNSLSSQELMDLVAEIKPKTEQVSNSTSEMVLEDKFLSQFIRNAKDAGVKDSLVNTAVDRMMDLFANHEFYIEEVNPSNSN